MREVTDAKGRIDHEGTTFQSAPTIKYTIVTRETCDVPAQVLADLLCAAFEGGINYWCERVERPDVPKGKWSSDAPLYGKSVVLHFDGEEKVLGMHALLLGVAQAAAHKGVTIEQFLGDHDAADADLAVQFALFQEIVYG